MVGLYAADTTPVGSGRDCPRKEGRQAQGCRRKWNTRASIYSIPAANNSKFTLVFPQASADTTASGSDNFAGVKQSAKRNAAGAGGNGKSDKDV